MLKNNKKKKAKKTNKKTTLFWLPLLCLTDEDEVWNCEELDWVATWFKKRVSSCVQSIGSLPSLTFPLKIFLVRLSRTVLKLPAVSEEAFFMPISPADGPDPCVSAATQFLWVELSRFIWFAELSSCFGDWLGFLSFLWTPLEDPLLVSISARIVKAL